MGKFKDIAGQRFGRLIVLDYSYSNKGAYWLCRCDCGNEKQIKGSDLICGNIISCGCAKKERFRNMALKHGYCGHRLYTIFGNIKNRCCNPNNSSYNYYGGRGITICDEWRYNFQTFYDWAMLNGYKEDLTIDRIDNNGNYEPNNCRFITHKENCNNTRKNVYITYNNKTQTKAEWSREYNIKQDLLKDRLKWGWSIEKALTTPVRKFTKKIINH